ncbi:hypothetical protein S40285_09536 [Stachybotrys chlorohalonatus IBT 40285]|uniref:Uncharacterized protein n=1 Tax=Stachybotrys chlorohalonatus (strain IBT 40285) TaxID=1283841 RepID=A0A084QZ97_STAC4|nr:hypothetical protein S40285_09536 [Stachybotrys chlorohalonata IBT 40285]
MKTPGRNTENPSSNGSETRLTEQNASQGARHPVAKQDESDWLSRSHLNSHLLTYPARDHLLNLIQYNVFSGLIRNKSVLASFATYFNGEAVATPVTFGEKVYPGRAAIVSTAFTNYNTAANLLPTGLQSSIEHSKWIDLIPFPGMRDNLIKWEAYYDHAELAYDLIGNLLDLSNFPKAQTSAWPSTHKQNVVESSTRDEGIRDDLNSHGLILWGEPHNIESWEVTPGFLQKWGWTIEGCQNLVDFTNHWRLSRGEEPLEVTT